MDKQLKDVAKSLDSTSDGIVLKECILALARDSSILKKAYLGLVAKSVMTLTVCRNFDNQCHGKFKNLIVQPLDLSNLN